MMNAAFALFSITDAITQVNDVSAVPLSKNVGRVGYSNREIKHVFSDIDGTLTHAKDITIEGNAPPPSTIDLLERLALSDPVDLILTTGRSPAGVEKIANLHMPFLDLNDSYMIANNGSIVYSPGWNIASSHDLNLDAVALLEDAVKGHKDVDLYAYLIPNDEFVMTYHDFTTKNEGAPRVCDFVDTIVLPAGKTISEYAVETGQRVNVMKAKCETFDKEYYEGFWSLDGFETHLSDLSKKLQSLGVSYNRALDNTIDILSVNANKGDAVAKVLEMSRSDKRQCLSLGDGSNDVELMSSCTTSVAMGNGKGATKRAASFVTERIELDGWVQAVNRFVDIPQKLGKNGKIVNVVVTDDVCSGDLSEDFRNELLDVNVPIVHLYPLSPKITAGPYVAFGGSVGVVDGDVVYEDKIDGKTIKQLAKSTKSPVVLVSRKVNSSKDTRLLTVLSDKRPSDQEMKSLLNQFKFNNIIHTTSISAGSNYTAMYISADDELSVDLPRKLELVVLSNDGCSSDSKLLQVRKISERSSAVSHVLRAIGGSMDHAMSYSHQDDMGVYKTLSMFENNSLVSNQSENSQVAMYIVPNAEAAVRRYIGFELMKDLYHSTPVATQWYERILRGAVSHSK
eukprot:GHVH01004458.1.p1 GENE.GHVH01004458.1~~GHVH01004458.1.p1  ORF type:complete len:624 (-),score=94.32 GHVH01004458.1:521-2392(-)